MLRILFRDVNANGLFGNRLNCSIFLSGPAHVSSLQNLLAASLVSFLIQHLGSEIRRAGGEE